MRLLQPIARVPVCEDGRLRDRGNIRRCPCPPREAGAARTARVDTRMVPAQTALEAGEPQPAFFQRVRAMLTLRHTRCLTFHPQFPLTRLETRTKESNMYASLRVIKLFINKGAMKVTGTNPQGGSAGRPLPPSAVRVSR